MNYNFEFNKESENWVVRVTFKIMVVTLATYGVATAAWMYGGKVIAGAKKLWTGFKKKNERRGYSEMSLGNEE